MLCRVKIKALDNINFCGKNIGALRSLMRLGSAGVFLFYRIWLLKAASFHCCR